MFLSVCIVTSLSLEGVGGVLVWVALALELVHAVVLRHLVVMDHVPTQGVAQWYRLLVGILGSFLTAVYR